jgi:hypothetical protein
MTARPIPERHWRSYGTDPLPTPAEAMMEPMRAEGLPGAASKLWPRAQGCSRRC